MPRTCPPLPIAPAAQPEAIKESEAPGDESASAGAGPADVEMREATPVPATPAPAAPAQITSAAGGGGGKKKKGTKKK